jgi:ATP-binding cassette subfamily B protein/ATP-binding cassette subfamily C protein/ATP-binding cassette subfamily B multidrug efflux pump
MTDTSAGADDLDEHPDLRRVGADDRRKAFALLWNAARPDAGQIVWATGWLAVAGLLEALGPLFGKRFIDEYLLPRSLDWTTMAWLVGGYLVTGWAATLIRYFQLVRLAGLSMRSVRRLRESVYNHVMRLPLAFFDRASTGQLVSRITNDTEAVLQLYAKVLFELLLGATVLFGVIVAMLWLDWRLMLLVLLLIPATVGIVWGYQRLSAQAVTRSRALRSTINARMAEGIAGMSVLQASGAAERYGKRFAQTNREQYRARMGEVRANAWLLRPALDFVNIMLIVVLVAVVGNQQLQGVEVGLLYAFIAYVARIVEPLTQITMQFSMLQQSVIAASRVNTLLHEDEMPVVADTVTVTEGRVTISEVTFGYDPLHPVLHDINLAIPAGGFVGIVGHTGSGKSTLLSLLLRFYSPQSGRIEIDGVPVAAIGDAQFRHDVGLVPQEPFLLAASAGENIDMGRGLAPDVIVAAARAARAHGFIEQLPQGYATPLGEGGARLSAGQKQLIAVARALAGAPKVLVLDEATSRIDSETEQLVQAAIGTLQGHATVIAIAHRLSTIRAADLVVVLNHGRIAEQGTHDALMAIEGGIYRRLYVLQQFAE